MKKRLLSMLLTACMLVSLAPALSITAFAEATEVTGSASRVTWSGGEYVVNSSVSIAGLDITGDVTLTISEGCTLTVTGADGIAATGTNVGMSTAATSGKEGIAISSGATLTLKGTGTISAIGGKGGKGWSSYYDSCWSGGGGGGIVNSGTLSVDGPTVNAQGGNGGDGHVGTTSQSPDYKKGGVGGKGGNGITGTLLMSSGRLEATAGAGGAAGNGFPPYAAGIPGNPGSAISLSADSSITGGSFNVDISDYTPTGYACSYDSSSGSYRVHAHAWTYAAGGTGKENTLLAYCTADNCPGTAKSKETAQTLTISAPKLTTYGGTESEKATLSGTTLGGLTVSDSNVKYYKKGTDGNYGATAISAPKTPGSYKAVLSVTSGGSTYTACVTYDIAKADLAASDFTYTAPDNLTYSNSAKAATVKTDKTGTGKVTIAYYSDEQCTTSATPTDAGTYYVGITVAEGDNYKATTAVLKNSSWKFEIVKANQTVSAPTAQDNNIKCYSITLDTAAAGKGDTYYAKSSANTKPGVDSTDWQKTTEFTGLSLNTTYYFFVKYAGNDNYNYAISDGKEIKTLNHYHDWTFELAEGTKDTINAVCVGPGGEDTCKSFDSTLVRTIKLSAESPVYDGKAHGAKLDKTSLAEITELPKIMYQLKKADGSYDTATETAPTDAGAYKATFTVTFGEDNSKSVTAEVEYTIKPADIKSISAKQDGTLTYNREEQTAEVTTAATTVNSQEYAFTYCDTEDGTYTATVPSFTDAGDHTVYYKVTAPNHNEAKGSFTVTILPKTEELSVDAIADVSYTGKQRTPPVTVRDETVVLVKDSDYTVSYGTNVEGGVDAGTVTVTFKGNYKGTITKSFTINQLIVSGDTTAKHTDVKTYTAKLSGNRPANTTVVWDITGATYEYVGSHIGTDSVTIICESTGTLKVTATLVDYTGKPVKDADGNIVQTTQNVKVQAKAGTIINAIVTVTKTIAKGISKWFGR